MGCNCCSKFGCDLEAVKSFFHKLVHEYWSVKCPPLPKFTSNKEISVQTGERNRFALADGEQLAIFSEKYCTFLSKHKPLYVFYVPVGEETKTISMCLPTTVKIFGLPTKAFQIVKKEHTKDTKKIGLSLLKFFSKNFTKKKI